MRPATLAGYFGFVLIGCNTVLVPSLIRSIEHDFRQSDPGLGLFYFVEAIAYASGSFTGGFLTERLGRKRILTAGALLFGVGLVGMSASLSWALFLLSSVAANWGAGTIDGGTSGLFLDLYPSARGRALNLLNFFFGVGALVAPLAIGRLVAAGVDWRIGMLATGMGALALGCVLASVRMPGGLKARVDETRVSYTGVEQTLLPFAGLAIAICCYVAAEMAISGWLVKFLIGVPLSTATGVLSVFWAGLALGRLLSIRLAERLDYVLFAVLCVLGASLALIGAVLIPVFPVSVVLFGFTGLFYAPVYPMIVAIGGNLYPHRIAALSGSLAASAVVGAVIYPPLIGVAASRVGLAAGLVGAGLLGVPAALAIFGASSAASRALHFPSGKRA